MSKEKRDGIVFPVVEEQAVVRRVATEQGRVRVQQTTSSREEVAEEAVSRTTAEVDRRVINREVDAIPEIRSEGELLYIPVVEEELVVTKRLILREEIVVRRTVETETVRVPVTLRRTEVTVERDDTMIGDD